MTGVEVMYQPYSYPSYFSYQQSLPEQKFGFQTMQDTLDSANFSSTSAALGSSSSSSLAALTLGCSTGLVSRGGSGLSGVSASASGGGATGSSSAVGVGGSGVSSSSSLSLDIKEEDDKDSEPKDTRYLNANCVLLTYFSGDINSMVDEHFSRALSQSSGYSSENQGSKQASSWKDSSPMSHRNFPPSFWNSSFQPTPTSLNSSAHDLGFGTEHYLSSSLHGLSGLHQDPWHYPGLSSAAHQGHAFSHRSLHDLPSYAPMSMTHGAGPSRYNSIANIGNTLSNSLTSHYGSFLMTPQSVHQAAAAAACLSGCDGVSKSSASAASVSGDPWSSRYHSHSDRYHTDRYHTDHRFGSDFTSAARSYLDTSLTDKKDFHSSLKRFVHY